MKLPRRRWWLLPLLLLGVACDLSAQLVRTVKEIEIRHVGPPAVSDELIRAHIRTKPGDAYNPASTDDDLLSLKATGYFLDIRVAADTVDGGVKLIYALQGLPTLTEIRLEGNKQLSDKKLMKVVTSKVGQPLDEQKVFQDVQAMRKLYEKAGYRQTRIERKTAIDAPQGRGTVAFEIFESPRVKIEDVVFTGAEAFSASQLRRVMKTRRYWMFSWLTGSGRLKEDEFAEDRQRLKEFYMGHGYIDFELKEMKIEYLGPKKLTVRVTLFEGKQYKVGSVEFRGNEKFTAEQIRRGTNVLDTPVRLRMLEGAVFTTLGLDRDIATIQDFYGAHGYIGRGADDRIRVSATRNPNVERGTMDLVYRVTEGEPSTIEKIDIRGNIKTKDRVIRRELTVTPGEKFDMVRVQLSRQRVEGLRYFARVDTEVEPTDIANSKNLVIAVDEQQSGEFFFGAGFSSIDSLYGYIGMTQGNFDLFNPPYFTGGGQKLRLQGTIGTEFNNYEAIFTEPWFLGRKLSLDVNMFHRDIQYYSDYYTQRETGAIISLMQPLFIDAFRVGLSYTIQNIDLEFDPSQTATNVLVQSGPGRGRTFTVFPPAVSPELLSEAGSKWVSQIAVTLALDTRRGGDLPNRGQRSQISAAWAGDPLGGTVDYYKLDFESGWYFPGLLKGHVLEVGGRIGVVSPHGGATGVPIFARYFLGGANTLRGYEYRDVGPRDSYNNPMGGESYWMGSAEYSVPIMQALRFAVFYDVGMVYADAFDFNFSDYADNWGVGIRLNIPRLGPLRLDYGIPITHPSYLDGGGQFQISAGYHRPF